VAPMAETNVTLLRCEIATSGLLKIDQIGSGVGVILYSPSHKTAAGLHILAPRSGSNASKNPVMCADTAIPYVMAELGRRGLKPPLSVAIAGGAVLLKRQADSGRSQQLQLVEAVKEALKRAGLSVKIEETGGTKIRSMTLNIDEGKIRVA
jgi:chemotaxis receptor (MCP) glutamine deamidase CheD